MITPKSARQFAKGFRRSAHGSRRTGSRALTLQKWVGRVCPHTAALTLRSALHEGQNAEGRRGKDTAALPTSGSRRQASVLLEVLLALILFAAAAAVVTTAFNSSMSSLERQKTGLQALNLAASVVAEVQLGIRPANSDGPRPLESPFQDWSWETTMAPTETATANQTSLTRLEVVVRHQKSATVQRLAQVVHLRTDAATNSVSSPAHFD